jgi:hypothetical protein
LRGNTIESFHRGSIAIVDADGLLVQSLGDVDRPIFPRSACKVLQALPLVASGAAEALSLSDEELALACASHGGEPRHTATALTMLAKAGLTEDALECGVQWPSFDGALKALAREGRHPGPLNNNCSGKHSGFVCVGCRGSVDGSWCADRCFGHCGCDESVGGFVDCAGFDWWCVDHWVHSDVFAGFVHVHDCDHELHGHGFDRWRVLYVHGESHERFG